MTGSSDKFLPLTTLKLSTSPPSYLPHTKSVREFLFTDSTTSLKNILLTHTHTPLMGRESRATGAGWVPLLLFSHPVPELEKWWQIISSKDLILCLFEFLWLSPLSALTHHLPFCPPTVPAWKKPICVSCTCCLWLCVSQRGASSLRTQTHAHTVQCSHRSVLMGGRGAS